MLLMIAQVFEFLLLLEEIFNKRNLILLGCNLCLSVCPIIDCITMVPKTIPHVIKRGYQNGNEKYIHALSPSQ